MSKFGWSYPAGCSGPPEPPDPDAVCSACGEKECRDPAVCAEWHRRAGELEQQAMEALDRAEWTDEPPELEAGAKV